LALIGVLVLFWTKINLFETLTVLLIAGKVDYTYENIIVIPAVVIGNIALRQRKNNN
jgi:Oligosaccharyltransferase subunit Ribophorin II.